MYTRHLPVVTLLAVAALASACGDGTRSRAVPAASAPTTGEPLDVEDAGAPITFRYTVNGNPVVGKPVSVSIMLSTPVEDRPITLTYRAPEAGSLEFPESQSTSIEILPIGDAERRPLQVTVIPQRDGRLFLTMAARMETDVGAVMRSISIPLQVARAPLNAAGEDDVDGE